MCGEAQTRYHERHRAFHAIASIISACCGDRAVIAVRYRHEQKGSLTFTPPHFFVRARYFACSTEKSQRLYEE
jgi:hypothetical protein